MAVRKIVGQVTEEEKREIKTLFERRNGLKELTKILDHTNEELYEKLIRDMNSTQEKYKKMVEQNGTKIPLGRYG